MSAAVQLLARCSRPLSAVPRPPFPTVAAGMVFGAAVWFISYQGSVPALGIMAPPSRDRPGRPQAMLAAHLVHGAVLGALVAWQVKSL